MPDNFENPNESDYEAELQRDRARQRVAAPTGEAAEKTGPDLNIVELTLALILALGVDFGIGWAGGMLASAIAAVPLIGQAGMAVIFFLAKFATVATAMMLGLWCLLRFKKFPWKRWGGAAFVESIPFLGELAPSWTAFVLSVIIKEKIMPLLQKYGAPAEKIATAIPLPQTQAAAKAIKVARVATEAAAKT